MLKFDVLVEAPFASVGFHAGGDRALMIPTHLICGSSMPLAVLLLGLAIIVLVMFLLHNKR